MQNRKKIIVACVTCAALIGATGFAFASTDTEASVDIAELTSQAGEVVQEQTETAKAVCDGTGSGNGNGICDGTGDVDGDGICDGTGSGNGNGNGVCDGTGSGNSNGNGVCDGTGSG
ncbi:MAG: hypothetical protein GX852_04905, partial [Clostridiales bacterium]|nr:hypothetical protein [Clostridiales bacterium]